MSANSGASAPNANGIQTLQIRNQFQPELNAVRERGPLLCAKYVVVSWIEASFIIKKGLKSFFSEEYRMQILVLEASGAPWLTDENPALNHRRPPWSCSPAEHANRLGRACQMRPRKASAPLSCRLYIATLSSGEWQRSASVGRWTVRGPPETLWGFRFSWIFQNCFGCTFPLRLNLISCCKTVLRHSISPSAGRLSIKTSADSESSRALADGAVASQAGVWWTDICGVVPSFTSNQSSATLSCFPLFL